MSRMKRWLIIGGLAAAQAAIVFCYLELQTAAPARATAEQPAPDAEKAPCKTAEQPVAKMPAGEPAHACPAVPPLPSLPAADATEIPPLPAAPVSTVAQAPAPPPPPEKTEAPKSTPLPKLAQTPPPPAKADKAPSTPEPLPTVGPKAGPEPARQPEPTAPSPPPPVSPPAGPPPAPPVHEVPPIPAPEPPPPLPSAKSSKEAATPQPVPPVKCPWTFNLVIVDGRTVLTAKTGEEVQFKVSCDRLDLQAPNGAIQASGSIKLSSAGLEGSAERLTINLHEDRVVLDGVARLKARRDGQELELQSDRLSLRIIDGRLSDRAEPAEPRPDL